MNKGFAQLGLRYRIQKEGYNPSVADHGQTIVDTWREVKLAAWEAIKLFRHVAIHGRRRVFSCVNMTDKQAEAYKVESDL